MTFDLDEYPIRPELYGCQTRREVEDFVLDGDRDQLDQLMTDAIYRRDMFSLNPDAPIELPIRHDDRTEKPRRTLYERFLGLFGLY